MLNKGNLLGNNFIFPSNIKYRKHHKNKILIKFVLVILIICLDIIFYLRKLRVESIINIDNKTQNISLINQENNWENRTNNTNHEINNTKKRIGVISVENDQNPGNTLVKFSMSTKLKELGFDPTIIALTNKRKNYNLTYLRKIVKLKEIKFSFYELKQNEYDILMVNSDQTWTYNIKKNFYDIAFLQFAYNWKIPKFVYGASMGTKHWRFNSYDDMQAKKLLKNFTGISLRENMLVPLAAEHLGINASFVLDPTFLIDKNYYLDLIKNYNRAFDFGKKYLLIYKLRYKKEKYYTKNNLKRVIQKYIIYQNDEKEQKDKESIPEIWFFSDNSDKRRKLLKDEFGHFNYLPILNSTNENGNEDSIYSKNENELFYHYLYYKTLMCKHCNLSDKNQENDLCPYAHDILKDFRIIYDNKSEEIGAFMSKLLKSKLFNFENYLNYIPMSLSSEFNLDTFKVHMCQLDNNCPNDYHLCPYYHSSNEYDGPRRPHLLFCYTGNTGDICFNEKKKKYYPKKCNCGIFCQYLHSKNEYNYHPEHFRKIYQCTRKKEKGKCKYYKTCYGIHSNESNEATEEEQEEEYENIEEEVEGDEQVEEKKEKINNAFVVAKNFRCRKCQKVSDNGELIYFLKCKHFLCIKCFKKIAIKKKNLKDNEQFSFHCPFCEKIVEKDGAIKVEFAS